MAELTTTITSFAPVGDHVVITGSFTGEQDNSHIVLAPSTGTVLSCNISAPAEDAVVLTKLNFNSGAGVLNGSVMVSTTADSGTYSFVAHIAGAYF